MKRLAIALALLGLSSFSSAQVRASLPYEACFNSAANQFKVDKRLLVAIAKTESSLDPTSISPKNTNGSYDMGLMQINSSWLPTLSKLGINEQTLMQPCMNIHVGAWILAQNISRHGQTWKAVGAYNAATPSKQQVYVSKVQRNYALVGSYFNS